MPCFFALITVVIYFLKVYNIKVIRRICLYVYDEQILRKQQGIGGKKNGKNKTHTV